jgi:hypothetical protein
MNWSTGRTGNANGATSAPTPVTTTARMVTAATRTRRPRSRRSQKQPPAAAIIGKAATRYSDLARAPRRSTSTEAKMTLTNRVGPGRARPYTRPGPQTRTVATFMPMAISMRKATGDCRTYLCSMAFLINSSVGKPCWTCQTTCGTKRRAAMTPAT